MVFFPPALNSYVPQFIHLVLRWAKEHNLKMTKRKGRETIFTWEMLIFSYANTVILPQA